MENEFKIPLKQERNKASNIKENTANLNNKTDKLNFTIEKIKPKPQPTKLIDNRDHKLNQNKLLSDNPQNLQTQNDSKKTEENNKDLNAYSNLDNQTNKQPEAFKIIESEYNPWNNEINFIQDTGTMKDFLDFCKFNSITKFQENKKGFFLNDIANNGNKTNRSVLTHRQNSKDKSSSKNKEGVIVLNKYAKSKEENIFEKNLSESMKKQNQAEPTENSKSSRKAKQEENNFICNYFSNENTEENEKESVIPVKTNKDPIKKAEDFLKTYEKYQVKKEDKKSNDKLLSYYDEFISNIDQAKNENMKNKKNITDNNPLNIIETMNNKDDVNNLLYGKSCFIEILDKLNSLSYDQFKKGIELEDSYEKYRFENLLSKEKIEFITDVINNLNEILSKIDNNRIKISTLIHNNSMNDNSFIKIKHKKKFDLINCLKLISCQIKSNDILELIYRSSNLSANTLKLITEKFDYLAKEIRNLCNEE